MTTATGPSNVASELPSDEEQATEDKGEQQGLRCQLVASITPRVVGVAEALKSLCCPPACPPARLGASLRCLTVRRISCITCCGSPRCLSFTAHLSRLAAVTHRSAQLPYRRLQESDRRCGGCRAVWSKRSKQWFLSPENFRHRYQTEEQIPALLVETGQPRPAQHLAHQRA